MKRNSISRRSFIAAAGAALTACSVTVAQGARKKSSKTTIPFSYCFNTSTIRGQNLSLDKEIEITAKQDTILLGPGLIKSTSTQEAEAVSKNCVDAYPISA